MVTASHHAADTIKLIFISWSKSRSHRVALALKQLIYDLFARYLKVFISDDVGAGTTVLPTINNMLREADLVVPCMTSENWNEPWIFYEVGVVFGKADRAIKVCPYVVDLNKTRSELPDPLHQFKALMADRVGTLELIKMINNAIGSRASSNDPTETGQPLYADPRLETDFDTLWPKLEEVIKANQPPPVQPDPRLYLEDHSMVTIYIDSHHDRLEVRLNECIDQALEAVRSNTYDYEQIVEFTWREIEASKERYRDRDSILVGNVAEFFGDYYSEDDLRRVMKSMERDLPKSPEGWDSETVKDRLVARVQRALEDAFKRFHRILSTKLRECMAEE